MLCVVLPTDSSTTIDAFWSNLIPYDSLNVNTNSWFESPKTEKNQPSVLIRYISTKKVLEHVDIFQLCREYFHYIFLEMTLGIRRIQAQYFH